MAIQVRLQTFEGPLDLLLHLIDKNKVNICDIPISEITEQYLSCIGQMQSRDLDVASEFMVMAATLISIKCRMLLPKNPVEDGESEDPREELVRQLLDYKIFKYISCELKSRMTEAKKVFFHEQDIPKEVLSYVEPLDTGQLLKDISLPYLYKTYMDILKRQEDKRDPIRSKFGKIEKEDVSMPEVALMLEEYVRTHGEFYFADITDKSRERTIVTFLVVLEMMKNGVVCISQDEIFGDIKIKSMICNGLATS